MMRQAIILFTTFAMALMLLIGSFVQVTDAATSRVAVIKELRGTVKVKKSGGSKQFTAFAKMTLNEGDVLMTGADSSAVLQFSNGSSEDDKLSVSSNTTLKFSKLSDRNGTRTKVSMLNGAAWVDVKSIVSTNDEFTLETPTAVMGVRGTHLLVSVDAVTGSTRLTVAAGVVNASTTGSSEAIAVLPNEDAVFTEDDEDVSIAPTDLELLMAQSDRSIVEAIVKAAGDIVKENEEKKDLYIEQSRAQDEQDKSRLKSNIENLLGAIVDKAVTSGLISQERANQIVAESQAQTGVVIDLTKREIQLSDEEKRRQEVQKDKENEARKAADERKKQQEEERKKNEDLLKKIENERKHLEEANRLALEAKKKKALDNYKQQLDDEARLLFEAEREKREREAAQMPTPTPSPTPSISFTVIFDSNGGSNVASQTVLRNNTALEPIAPTKTGYAFIGWYSDSGLTQAFQFTTQITASMTLYAKWSQLYTVTYDGNTEVGLTALDRTGWTAMAYPANQEGDVPANMLDGDANTRWSTGTLPEAGQYFIIDMKTARTFSRIVMDTQGSSDDYLYGYEVYVSDNGVDWGTAVAGGTDASTITTVDLATQHARYLKVVSTADAPPDVESFWSVHELNVYMDSGSAPTDNHRYTEGEEVTVLGNTGSLVKEGHGFAGWNTEADGSGTFYADGYTFPMGSSNIILYAQWMPYNTLVNAGFESPDVSGEPNKYISADGTTLGGWTYYSYSGIAHNGSAIGAADAPEGYQAAILPTNSRIGQAVYFMDGVYKITFRAAALQGETSIDVLLDSTLIDTLTTTSTSFELFTSDRFAATAGIHQLTFVGNSADEHIALIDDIQIIREPTAAEIAATVTSVTAPNPNATSLVLPGVPNGYTIAIHSSSNNAVINVSGTITPMESDTEVVLVFAVTRTADNTIANTAPIAVTIPAKDIEFIPRPPGSVNVALSDNGGTAAASSTHGSFDIASINDGDKTGNYWSFRGGWNDDTPDDFPDWVQVNFDGIKKIREIGVITLQDNFDFAGEPNVTTKFHHFGVLDYEVQYWDLDQGWVTVTNGIVTDNQYVWRQFTFAPVETDRIRILITRATDSYSRMVEVEAWTDVDD